MNKVEKLNEVMDDGGSFQPILSWVHVRLDIRDDPFPNKRLIHLAAEESF